MKNKELKQKEDLNKKVLEEIRLLISKAPDYWMDVVCEKMGKTREQAHTVRSYIRGDRGIKKGYHKDILRILKELVAKEEQDTLKLLSNGKTN